MRGRWPSAVRTPVIALHDVCLEMPCCATLAIVGRSGAGKSTLARCLCRLETPDSGSIEFEQQDFTSLRGREFAKLRRSIQLVFQQSASAISPHFTVLEAIGEPLRIQGECSYREQKERARGAMQRVGLAGGFAERLTSQLSGGERQRVALARAIIVEPKLLILDEGLAGLDRTTEARMVDLILQLKEQLSLSYVFITHDLRLAVMLAQRIAVMHAGRIIEAGAAAHWRDAFSHPESRKLIEAADSLENLETVISSPSASARG